MKCIRGNYKSCFMLYTLHNGDHKTSMTEVSYLSRENDAGRFAIFFGPTDQSLILPINAHEFQSEISSTSKPGLFSWFLAPLSQNVQISPQTLQDRVTQIKETLSNLGLRNRDPIKGKQLSNANNLLHLIGPNDSGFYTNRIEPAGFFGGNGWLANKGGILGGPGAIFSTGSILTDYPTAYRRK